VAKAFKAQLRGDEAKAFVVKYVDGKRQ